MKKSLYFTALHEIEICAEPLPIPAPDQLLVQTIVSAISAGTEMLFYRGQVPPNLSADATIDALSSSVDYPLKYGYACVGRVIGAGADVPNAEEWSGRIVFAFNPHESHFCARPEALIPVPDDIPAEQAALLPNMETAVNFTLDGAPQIGERVAVIGQGIVGLLTTSLLAQFPVVELIAIDRIPHRLAQAKTVGATHTLNAVESDNLPTDLDLVYELSGNPAALNMAINLCGFDARVIVGSWYGTKRAEIELGGHFHRNRIRLISSQVSTLAPATSGRWSKTRRLDLAWSMLRQIDTAALFTHRVPFDQAAGAYALLDERPEDVIQVLFTYEGVER